MKLEDQVCSLELAKKLQKLGVSKPSLFYWIAKRSEEIKVFGICYIDRIEDFIEGELADYEYYSAFTVAELGELLPKVISITEKNEEKMIFSNFRLVSGRNMIIKDGNPLETWSVNYICDTTNEFRNWLFDKLLSKPISDNNEANARAKMLIYLVENKLITL